MTISLAMRSALHERAYGCCEGCGVAGATNAHHRINQSQGGPDTLANLLLLCGSGTTGCHGWVTANPTDAKRCGFTVWPGKNPAEVPVLRWSREFGGPELVLLDDDGGLNPVAVEGSA